MFGWIYFLFGLAIGSFLNVVIDRLPLEESLVHGRSKCDHCNRQLKWWELFPVLSFVFLKGRCASCHHKLSWQYPAIEILTGFTFYIYFLNFPLSVSLSWLDLLRVFIQLIFILSLVAIAMIDIKHGIIPDEINIFLLVIFGIYRLVELIAILGSGVGYDIWLYKFIGLIWSGFLAAGFFYLLIVLTKGRGMGGGDVKLAFIMGLFLGPNETFLAIYLSFILGGIVAITTLVTRNKKFGQTIPFGPFLAIGSIISLLWSGEIIKYYLSFLIN